MGLKRLSVYRKQKFEDNVLNKICVLMAFYYQLVIQLSNIELLSCSRHCSRCWRDINEHDNTAE